jgi:uncharacterized protein YqjF (DUF2071 family)
MLGRVHAPSIDRIEPTRRPSRPAQGRQRWRTLLFLHWEVPVETLRPLVPERLTIDTFEGRAFVGLVPFTMQGVRPWRWAPPVPGAGSFHETNVRTYVYLEGAGPGVWFFSLDAASSLAVLAGRRLWRLPYCRADMQLYVVSDAVEYRARRMWPEPNKAALDLPYRVGERLEASAPGTLQHFLAERYLLYAQGPKGTLLRGQVHHAPYPLHAATVSRLDESLLAAAGIAREGEPMSALYSPGVDVEVFPLEVPKIS